MCNITIALGVDQGENGQRHRKSIISLSLSGNKDRTELMQQGERGVGLYLVGKGGKEIKLDIRSTQ